ncbi:MAG: hypothetical protein ACPGCW_00355 [Schleiferiaceae bacterium]|jgi:hypothetical protein
MKKSILLVVMFLVGNGAFAQGKVNMQNSSASTQTGVVKSQPQAPAATSGIMMNDIDAVSGSYLNGEISIDGDQIYIKAMNNFGSLECQGHIHQISTTQMLVLGSDLISGESYTVEIEPANTGNPEDALQILVPSSEDMYILKYEHK